MLETAEREKVLRLETDQMRAGLVFAPLGDQPANDWRNGSERQTLNSAIHNDRNTVSVMALVVQGEMNREMFAQDL